MVKLRTLGIFLFLLFIAICDMRYAICNLYAQDRIIAIVNSDVITQKDLDDFLNFMSIELRTKYKGKELEDKLKTIRSDLIERLIEDRLILQEAKKNNIQIDESRVKAKINEIRKQYFSDTEFQAYLAQYGLVQADLEEKIREEMLMYAIVDMKVRSKITVNPTEVTDYFQKNVENFKLPEQREFESITLENKDLADEISLNLKNGQDLESLIQRYHLTINKLSASGDGQLRKDIEEVVFSLKPDEVSEPIKIEDKYYIFRLVNIIPARQQTLSEVQDKINLHLVNYKMEEEFTNWIDEIKKNSYIKILQG
jgi:parvulin-like peptidyl-prolyl isomerase